MAIYSHAQDKISIKDLRAAVSGRVIDPDDPGYDEARTVFYGGIDRRPAAIVRPANVKDIISIIHLARESGIELAVRGGGHSMAGHGVSEGGIVLDLCDLRSLDIDVDGRTAWAGAGLTAGAYTSAAGAHGLVTGFGDTGSVGIGGITLGGGIGFLVRKYGLTIDSLLAAEIATADGQHLHIDEHHHPDLFWAIRGGGGNFGVVTRFQYRLHEVPSIVGGMLFLPATPEVIAGIVAAAEAAPEELSTIANVMPAPPMPFVPAEIHGQMIVFLMLVYAGETEAGQRAIAPFRQLARPLADMVRPMTYAEMFPSEEGGYHPIALGHTMFVDHIRQAEAEKILQHLQASDARMRAAQIRVMGGAMARVPADATAFAHRQAKIMLNLIASYQGPEDQAVQQAWLKNFAAAMHQGNDGAYVNFLENEGEARIRAAYPGATWERLAAIKARYDPTNLFRLNQNIQPASQNR